MRNVASSEVEPVSAGDRMLLVQFRQGDVEARDAAFESALPAPSARRPWVDSAHRAQPGGRRGTDHGDVLAHLPRPRTASTRSADSSLGATHRHPRRARLAAGAEARVRDGRMSFSPICRRRRRAIRRSRPRFAARPRTGLWRGLRPGLRIAAMLAVIEERPHKEVAEALGISVTAVKLRVFRALRLLRKDLQQQGITP